MNNTLSFLVVEDSEDDVILLRLAFRKAAAGSSLQVVGNGAEAIAYLKGEGVYGDRLSFPSPQVLLLDLNMPCMNGFEVLQWIRSDPRHSRLIVHVLTASALEADVRRAYELHANSYIVKPTRMEELVALISVLHQWHGFVSLAEGVTQPKSEFRVVEV